MPGRLVFRRQDDVDERHIRVVNVREVPQSARYPLGIKPSFVLIRRRGDAARAVYRVDNAHGYGPHELLGTRQRPIQVRDWQQALAHFVLQSKQIRDPPREHHGD